MDSDNKAVPGGALTLQGAREWWYKFKSGGGEYNAVRTVKYVTRSETQWKKSDTATDRQTEKYKSRDKRTAETCHLESAVRI